ncbi:LOW QUALITY PROTEIN: cystathionine gamma-synthase 1, chloroplastic-like [Asparagus officinalis]|uniref:LOW QUALITY PROTEIN: cystathionine gamma-synthase 1, chloroplastic-like n=1 Tax=Asparagus officinalis TaxID=4686 RepID=UPI00098E1AA0|nr:LOW QUALITY PROTEIN: cystathionine gamma-synthase 1, chloroplastic-like [Asparagus officinalis]
MALFLNPNPSFIPSSPMSASAAGGNPRSFKKSPFSNGYGLSSALILKFPPNFVRQLSIKARRNCGNIGVAQVVAASWANSPSADEELQKVVECEYCEVVDSVQSQIGGLGAAFSSDASLLVHAGERYGRRLKTDTITTPIVNTSAYWFKNCDELIDFKEGRHTSFEYGRYGNPTTEVLERKMSELERAETTLFVSSGMYASCAVLSALVPAGGHIVTTTDCYRKTRMFIENELPKKGIKATVIAPADMGSLERALCENEVSLFFTESPTNPFLRCIDIRLVSELCHSKGSLVCIDSTFASPVNQKPLTLGADLVIHSATKFIAGHNDVIAGCVSGSEELVSKVRQYHHIIGGVLDPNAAYMISRGMKTMHLRVQYQNSIALRMAQFLEEHPKILRVYYPGLPSHPEHHIAKQQMTGFGGVVSFELAGGLLETVKFIDSLKIPYLAPSFGGCESIVEPPAIMSYWDSNLDRDKYGIGENLIRFSFGVEDFDDLKADIAKGLEAI